MNRAIASSFRLVTPACGTAARCASVIRPMKPNPTKPNPTKPNPTKPNPTKPNPTKPNRMIRRRRNTPPLE
ncbi:hypothetical protein GCM10022239_06780 [Leifsonia bigeumensis]|uniref:Secreted protein n=1 Tax=Leifsonella bigeumensis TaxID=433643 RepID=A0ABP7F7P4_9MICO